MSKRTSSKTKRQGANKAPQSTKDYTDSSTSEISDTLERRRMQNRLAQRNHRKKVRDHIKALEARVISSMLQRPPPYVLPLSQSGLSQPPTVALYMQGHMSQQNARTLQDVNDTIDQSYLPAPEGISPSSSTPPSEYLGSPRDDREPYPTPATSCVSLAPLCTPVTSPVETRSSGVTFEIVPQYRDPQLEQIQIHQAESLYFQPNPEYENYVPFANGALETSDLEYLSMENSISPTSSIPQVSNPTESAMKPNYHVQRCQPQSQLQSQQQHDWINGLASDGSDQSPGGTMHLFQPFQNPDPYEMPDANQYAVSQRPEKVGTTSEHYFGDSTSRQFTASSNPTQHFHESMAIYRSPKYCQ